MEAIRHLFITLIVIRLISLLAIGVFANETIIKSDTG